MPQIIDILLKAGAKPNVFDCNASARAYRAMAGDVESVRLLLDACAQTDQLVFARMSDTGRKESQLLPLVLSREIEALQHKAESKAKVVAYKAILDLLHKTDRKRTIKRITVSQLLLLRSPSDVQKVEESE